LTTQRDSDASDPGNMTPQHEVRHSALYSAHAPEHVHLKPIMLAATSVDEGAAKPAQGGVDEDS
jgi:hypothetical protein